MMTTSHWFNRLSASVRGCTRGHARATRLAGLALVVGGLLALGSVQASPALAASNIVDLKVINGSSSGIGCGTGWTKLGTDLNKGAGGKYIYACVKYGAYWENHITKVYAVASSTRAVACKAGDIKIDGLTNNNVDGNLNAGSGGKYIFFCVNKSSAEASNHLSTLHFVVIAGNTPEWMALATGKSECVARATGHNFHYFDTQDLNDTVGGAYIYSCNLLD